MAGIFSVDDIRKSWGADWASAPDHEVINAYAGALKADPTEVATRLGYDPGSGGMNAKRLSASVDSYQGNLYGLGEAVAGSVGLNRVADWMRSGREENELQANVARSRAREMGSVDSFRDIGGVGDALNYAAGLGIQSLPYLGEAVVGGLTGGAAFTGTAARAGLSRAAAQNVARTAGGVAASYPSSVGDILANQREQSGEMDLGSAAALGIPYAAANAIGLEGAVGRRQLLRSGVEALDSIPGIKGGLARAGVTGLRTGLSEGASETFQEGMNQFGRMAVDPNETFFNDASNERFLESFVGGAVLGGGASTALGGWRRNPAEPTHLLGGDKTPFNPQLTSAEPGAQGELFTPDQAPLQQFSLWPPAPDPTTAPVAPGVPEGQMPLWSGVNEMVNGQPVELTMDELTGNRMPYMPTPVPRESDLWGFADPAAPRQLLGNEIDFTPTPVPAVQSSLGFADDPVQYDMFDGPAVNQIAPQEMVPEAPAPQADTQTGDLFENRPTSLVRTTFDMPFIRQTINAAVGGKQDQFTLNLAAALNQRLDSPQQALTLLDALDERLQTAQVKPATVERRAAALNAGRQLVEDYQRQMVYAQAREGQIRSRPGFLGQAPEMGNTTETEMRAAQSAPLDAPAQPPSLDAQLADTDARVAAGDQQRMEQGRLSILQRVLDDPSTVNPLGRFRAELRRAGITNLELTPQEQETLGRFEDAREAFSAMPLDDNQDEGQVPASPNEMDVESLVPERGARQQPGPRQTPSRLDPNFRLSSPPSTDEGLAAVQRAQERRARRAGVEPQVEEEQAPQGPDPRQLTLLTPRTGQPSAAGTRRPGDPAPVRQPRAPTQQQAPAGESGAVQQKKRAPARGSATSIALEQRVQLLESLLACLR